jgi:hypothetical protein
MDEEDQKFHSTIATCTKAGADSMKTFPHPLFLGKLLIPK